jgi:hypothetical protein
MMKKGGKSSKSPAGTVVWPKSANNTGKLSRTLYTWNLVAKRHDGANLAAKYVSWFYVISVQQQHLNLENVE